LVYIKVDAQDGSIAEIIPSTITNSPGDAFNSITMLEDGSLILVRMLDDNPFYHIPDPPRDGSPVTMTFLGNMIDGIDIEAVYTDCDGRLYLMDTGADQGSSIGNRLLRVTGDYLAGDFTYTVISDLEDAAVADIDDMGPGIDTDGEVTDNPGFAIDSGNVYLFDYVQGNGTLIQTGGDWGIHVLGGPLFADERPRLYLMDSQANLYELNPNTGGPAIPTSNHNGWSGLAGPLTDCETIIE